MFDISDIHSLTRAGDLLNSIRALTQAPSVCLAHKFDKVIEMSDRQIAEQGVSEVNLANFSQERCVKVVKTSLKLPRFLDESFQAILG